MDKLNQTRQELNMHAVETTLKLRVGVTEGTHARL